MTKSIMIVGVGGQGTILCGKLLTLALMEAGYDVKMSEIHGMSQRGGSVTSVVRYGEKVYSPVAELGGSDYIVAFEKLEALRNMKYLKTDGKLIVNDYQTNPAGVQMGKADYPQNLLERLSSAADTLVVPAAEKALKLGNIKVMNIVLLGALAKALDLPCDWEKIIAENVKPAFVEMNKLAFRIGYETE